MQGISLNVRSSITSQAGPLNQPVDSAGFYASAGLLTFSIISSI